MPNLSFRLTEKEYAAMQKLAEHAFMPLSTYVKSRILAHAREQGLDTGAPVLSSDIPKTKESTNPTGLKPAPKWPARVPRTPSVLARLETLRNTVAAMEKWFPENRTWMPMPEDEAPGVFPLPVKTVDTSYPPTPTTEVAVRMLIPLCRGLAKHENLSKGDIAALFGITPAQLEAYCDQLAHDYEMTQNPMLPWHTEDDRARFEHLAAEVKLARLNATPLFADHDTDTDTTEGDMP